MPRGILTVFIIAIQLIACGQLSGRELDYGLRLGLNFSSFTGNDISDESKKTGLIAGIYLERRLGPAASFDIELLYTQKGHVNSGFFYGTSTRTVRYTDYLEMPLTFKFYSSEAMPVIIFVRGGLIPALKVTDRIEYNQDNEEISQDMDNLKKLDILYVLGWGIYINKGANRSGIELRFSQSIDSIISDNHFLDIKNSAISIILSSNLRKFK